MKEIFDLERLPFSECRDIFKNAILDLNTESWLNLSEKVIEKNLKFIEVCYNYHWSIHWLTKYLNDNWYMLHWNYWNKATFVLALENEIENFKKWIFLIWYYFNRKNKIERLLLWGKTWSVYKIKWKFSKIIEMLANPLNNS